MVDLSTITDIAEIAGLAVTTPTAIGALVIAGRNALQNRHQRAEFNKFNPSFEVLDNYTILKDKLYHLMDESLKKDKMITILNIGLDLEYMLPDILQYIHDRTPLHRRIRLSYRGLVINPRSELIENLIGDGSNLQAMFVDNALRQLELFKHTFSQNKNISAELSQYDVPLTIHGVMLNDEHLMLGFTELSRDTSVFPPIFKMHGSAKPYIYMKNDKNVEATKHYFAFFKEWFEYYDYMWKKKRGLG